MIAYILYLLASYALFILFGAVLFSVGAGAVAKKCINTLVSAFLPGDEDRWVSSRILRVLVPGITVGAFLFGLSMSVFSLVHVIRPHLVDGMLIARIGERTDGRVLSKEHTNLLHSEERVI